MEDGDADRLVHHGNLEFITKNGEKLDSKSEFLKLDLGSLKPCNIMTGDVCTDFDVRRVIKINRGMVRFGSPAEEGMIEAEIPIEVDWSRDYKPDLNLKNLEECQAVMNTWLVEMGIGEGSKYWKKLQRSCIPLLCALLTPDAMLKDAYGQIFLMFAFTILDDTFDNYKDFWEPGIDTLGLVQAVDAFCAICQGEQYDASLEHKTIFPYFQNLCSLFQSFREDMINIGLKECEELILFTVDCLEANVWENRGWNVIDESLDKRKHERYYYMRRESTYGLLPAIELCMVHKKIVVPDRCRRDPLLYLIRRLWIRVSFIINDIISIQKEMENGEKENLLLIRGERMRGEKALQKTVTEFKNYMGDIIVLHQKLERKYRKSTAAEGVREYLALGKAIIQANHQFMLISDRYGRLPFEAVAYL